MASVVFQLKECMLFLEEINFSVLSLDNKLIHMVFFNFRLWFSLRIDDWFIRKVKAKRRLRCRAACSWNVSLIFITNTQSFLNFGCFAHAVDAT